MDQIENGFKEFMRRENLRKDEDNVKNFSDIKYGFYYNHDVKISFEQEYPAIFDKYMRRIDAFMKMIKHSTVFFRCIRNEEEIKYINEITSLLPNIRFWLPHGGQSDRLFSALQGYAAPVSA